MTKGPNTEYECAVCHKRFLRDRPDEEAVAELRKNFGKDVDPSECDEVCDGCFRKVMAAVGPS